MAKRKIWNEDTSWVEFLLHKHPARYHYDNLPFVKILREWRKNKEFYYINNILNLLA